MMVLAAPLRSVSLAFVVLAAVFSQPALAATKPAAPAKQFVLPTLSYAYNATEPVISAQIQTLHYTSHHNGSVRGLNTAMRGNFGNGTDTLVSLLRMVGKNALPTDQELSVRNLGGSHFNHALFWKVLSAPNATSTSDAGAKLTAQVNQDFGNFTALRAAFTASATSLFGSGWTWLCYQPKTKTLKVMNTPNQDSPVMYAVTRKSPCWPILGVDVWEHAYYLQYLNGKASYVSAFWWVINWTQVAANYEAALAGDLVSIATDF